MKVSVKKLFVAISLSLFLLTSASAGLKERIDKLLAQPSLKKVQFSINIVKADTGKAVYSRNAHNPLIPASNMKLIVTAAALKYLGPDFQYKTTVGLCTDDLVIIGSGDPLLGDAKTDEKYQRKPGWIFDSIIAALKAKNVTTIDDIIVDSTVFDNQRIHPNWPAEQLNKWYAAEVTGLNYNNNCVDMTVKNNNGKAVVSIEPQTAFVKIVNQVKVVPGTKGAVGAYRTSRPNVIVVRGRCRRQQGPFPVTVERPAAFFGLLLAENLEKQQIRATGKLIEKAVDCDYEKLAEYSTGISDCLVRCNKNSLQIAAESLFKTIAAKAGSDGKNGSWAGGRRFISIYLTQLGVPEKEFYIDDGSGLSRKNKLSANAVTAVLLDVYKSKNRQLYKDSLAVGGGDGTLAKYFREQKYKGKILGKTGYVKGVRTFSGLCTTSKGDFLFSILTNNNWQGRKAINDIVKAIIDENR